MRQDKMHDIPPGFRLLDNFDKVMEGFAPVYVRHEADDSITLGFHVGPQHCNPRGHCHGGTWATMADVLMGINISFQTKLGGPTINLALDFLGPATAGQWVEGHARVLQQTPNLGFADCVFTADGAIALRASATFRRKLDPYRTFEEMLAPEAPGA